MLANTQQDIATRKRQIRSDIIYKRFQHYRLATHKEKEKQI